MTTRHDFRALGSISGMLVSRRPGHMAALGRRGGKACALKNKRRPNGQYKAKGEP